MNLFLLVFVTIQVSLSVVHAELPYAQKILLKAEFDRTESILTNQVDELKNLRERITAATATRDENYQMVDTILVYVLQNLHKAKQMKEFNLIAAHLNDKETRKNFYYPVKARGGIEGKKVRYVSMSDYNCINPKQEELIQHDVILIEVDTGSLSNRMGKPTLQIAQKKGQTKTYLASYTLDNDDPFFKDLKAFDDQSVDYTDYFNCRFVGKYQKLEKENKALLKRYVELSKILNLPAKDFKKEKEEKTLTEEFVDLKKTLPEDDTAAPTDTDAKASP